MSAPGARDAGTLAALLALCIGIGLARPLLPVDETRYAAVAWEMWARGDFVLPVLNGQPYAHKPPLLFWLIHAGWGLFGVNAWWPRLVPALAAAATLLLVRRLARELWPQAPAAAAMAPYLWLATPLCVHFASALMFDMLLAAFVALGLLGLVRAWRGAGPTGFALYALGLGGGLLAKGPVAFIHLLPAALLAPWWAGATPPRWRRWYGGVGLGSLAGGALVLAWAVPAAVVGGAAYREAIFLRQSTGRMVESFAHAAPWYFYLLALPLMLAPWFLWPRWWAGLRALRSDAGVRLAACTVGCAFVFFSLISGKRWQYLLPEFAPFALLAARALVEPRHAGRRALTVPASTLLLVGLAGIGVAIARALPAHAPALAAIDARGLAGVIVVALGAAAALGTRRPAAVDADVRWIALATIATFAALLLAADLSLRGAYDLRPVAERLAAFEREGRPVALNERYHGQWSLAGRLKRPLEEIAPAAAAAWLETHPDGRVVFVHRSAADLPPGAVVVHEQRYRGSRLAILAPARIVCVSWNPAALARDTDLRGHQAGYRCCLAGVVHRSSHTAHAQSLAVFDGGAQCAKLPRNSLAGPASLLAASRRYSAVPAPGWTRRSWRAAAAAACSGLAGARPGGGSTARP